MPATRASRRLFVSPHLDDAVFSCGELIASTETPIVVTIFAGPPPPDACITRWDADCGFTTGDDIIGMRRSEDRAALDELGAKPIWLDFRDDQYGETRGMQELTHSLADVITREAGSAICLPLGLFHRDHRRASDAALALMERFTALDWYAYEDAIYRRIAGAVDERVHTLEQAGFALQRQPLSRDASAHASKRRAVACYRSQLRGLQTRRHPDDLFAPETYWSVARGRSLP
jgi:LmbE family N-acetylglucosaminyl deacetylase